ncbi:MAG: S9 family peptidase, partial [Rhodothermia bacterium]|nr:S9 family peptidase [Rhodothermia bacterium]
MRFCFPTTTALLLVCATIPNSLLGQTAGPDSLLTLDRLFDSEDFAAETYGPIRWLASGGYTTLESSESVPGTQDIVRHDPATGSQEVLVPAESLVPPGQTNALEIEDYHWSADHSRLLVFTNTKRVWRRNTRGDYWVLDLKSGRLAQLGRFADPSRLMFAKFSPDGGRVAYVYRNNIYVESLSDGEVTQLTHDGTTTVINGTFDWAYEEEFHIRDGFRWSPDGASIAYWQLDASGIRDFLLINNTDSLYSFVIPIQYPKAGTINSYCRAGIVPSTGGETLWFVLSDDPRNNYIPRMKWAQDSREIIMMHMNRLQNELELIAGDAETGSRRTIVVERDSAWVDLRVDKHYWHGEGGDFVWVTQKDGWRHVYLVSGSGQEETLVTPGEFDIVSVEHVDVEGGWLYFIASPEDPTTRYLYRARLDGSGEMERLTPNDQPGDHEYEISPDARWAIHTYSSFENPPVIDLVRLPDHSRVRVLEGNDRLRENVEALRRGEHEFFRVALGDTLELDGWVIKPSHFDSSAKYPVLFYVYGEPAGQTTRDRWGGTRYLWHALLAEQGYLVMSVDNRGTRSPRGRAWRKMIYGFVGVHASLDQAAALRQIREWQFVDSSRIGVWGWSGGGSMTLNMMFRYPDLYHTGMSVAPVPDQRFYDTIYQERYMGLPQENVTGY